MSGSSETSLDEIMQSQNPRPVDNPVGESVEDARDEPAANPVVEATPEMLAEAARHRRRARLNRKLLLEEVAKIMKS